jgi:ribosomal protein S18 acetylase RimI-like enzyme
MVDSPVGRPPPEPQQQWESIVEFRVVGAGDAVLLAELFAEIDQTFFRPHPLDAEQATRIAAHQGLDTYAMLLDDERPVSYGMLRGWDEGYAVPSLGVAVRTSCQGQGFGRLTMSALHALARERGSDEVRLRVHPHNTRARRLYDSMGYRYDGIDRGELVMRLRLDRSRLASPS